MAYNFGVSFSPAFSPGANFVLIGASPASSTETTNYFARNRLGNFIATTNRQKDAVNNVTLTYVAKVETGASATLVLGGDGESGFVLTRVSLRQTNTDFAILELTMHKNTGEHFGKEFSVSVPSCGWGICSAPMFSGTLLDDMLSVEWSAEVEHKDQLGATGDQIVGVSFNGRQNCTINMLANSPVPSLTTGWFEDSRTPSQSNTDHETISVTGHAFIAAT